MKKILSKIFNWAFHIYYNSADASRQGRSLGINANKERDEKISYIKDYEYIIYLNNLSQVNIARYIRDNINIIWLDYFKLSLEEKKEMLLKVNELICLSFLLNKTVIMRFFMKLARLSLQLQIEKTK